MGARFNAFVECCVRLGGLGQIGHQAVYDCLGNSIGFDSRRKPDEIKLASAAGALVATRFQLLDRLRQYESDRRKAKHMGRRFPVPAFFPDGEALRLLEANARWFRQKGESS